MVCETVRRCSVTLWQGYYGVKRDDGCQGPSPLRWAPCEPGLGCLPRTLGLPVGARGGPQTLACVVQPFSGGEERPGGLVPQEPPALAAAGSDQVLLPWQLGPAADLT